MTLPLVVLRPEPGLTATVAEAARQGLAAIAAPLFTIEPRGWSAPDAAEVDGLLIGSANALRHGGPALTAFVGKPVYAVGRTTAETAREAGFAVARAGDGGLQRLLDGLAGERLRLLRLAGEAHVPLEPPDGIELVLRIAYASVPGRLAEPAARAFASGAVALLHSAEAARQLAGECDRLGLARGSVGLAALAPRIAEAAGGGWREVRTAPEPTDAALLALAGDMCHAAAKGTD